MQKTCSLSKAEEKRRSIDASLLTDKLSRYQSISLDSNQTRRFRKVLELKKGEAHRLLSEIGKTYEKVRIDPFNISTINKGNRMASLLDKRYRDKNAFNALVIVANLCMAIGITLLLICPLNPIGNSLVAVGIFLGLTMLVVNKVQTHRFEKSWKILTNA